MAKSIKKQIRGMRTSAYKEPSGKSVSHKMSWIGDINKKRGEYYVFPTVAPKKGFESSTNKSDWKEQTPNEAQKRGELIRVNTRKKAEKLSAGSWKKGAEKRDAMKDYKKSKR